MRRLVLVAALLLGGNAFAQAPTLQETPMFAEQVKGNSLPPVDKRLPEKPWVVTHFAGGDGPGVPGGQVNMLIASARDTRLMTIYSNARLIVYDDKFKLQPDILESYEVKEGREFTFRLRPGHKWSDGQPFTTEDFRYFWEDVANNKELSPSGPSVELMVDGKPPKVEIIDATTIKYIWDAPNPYFIESQARAAPLFLFRPAHYLKKFHKRYTDPAEIAKSGRGGQQSWVQIHRRLDVMYANDNIELPTLNPWVNTTASPAQRFVFVRNPYYHRVDAKGQQLPYLDRVIFTVAATNLVPAKAGLGEADLQPRYLNMRDYTFLRKSSKSSGVDVRLWESGSGSQIALYPNLNAKDEVWRKLLRDVRFRRALSLAVDRDELNEVVYIGLAKPSNNTIMQRSVLFKPEYASKWANYDPKLANRLLDEVGLTKKNEVGIRLLPDGRPATIVVEHASEETEDADAMSLIADHWKKIGIKLLFKPQTRENFRMRTTSGDAIMTASAGVVTAVPTANTSPKEFAPAMQGGLQWSRWGLHVETKGRQGEKCDMPEACQLLDLLREWEQAVEETARRQVWDKMLAIYTDQVFSIGTVNGILQPIVVGPKVRNVPKEGYYAWDPGGYIGLYKPDTFWLSQ
ncbi:MAG TPA: ABC transporter substrate-binding protein [Reyranellaceae bacterium]|nr:ABC transporter substrate-binding protein [Reyranellaceae bacterium]